MSINLAMPPPSQGDVEGVPTNSGSPAFPAIQVERLTRSFGGQAVLSDVSFSVQPGGILGIAGANGSGKTVLMRLVATLDRPTSGSCHVHGSDTVRDARAVRRRIGYVPEEPMVYEGMSVSQYLEFLGRTRMLGREMRTTLVSTLLQVVGLDNLRDRDIQDLSPGERRRLTLAGALLNEPDVLLLDDPFRGLDGQVRFEQREVLRELHRMGTTILVTATRPEDVIDLCEHVAVLRNGRVVWTGTSAAAERLASPEQGAALRVRAEILEGLDPALTLLGQRRDVQDLEVDEDGEGLWFLFSGDREALATLLPQLVRAGTVLTHFGVEQRSPAAALAALFRG